MLWKYLSDFNQMCWGRITSNAEKTEDEPQLTGSDAAASEDFVLAIAPL